MTSNAPRMFFFDDNIRGVGGHFFELASLLIDGASELGYDPVLVANSEFEPPAECQFSVLSVLRQRRMVRWSLGVDGKSESIRSPTGRPVGGSAASRVRQVFRDHLAWPSLYPTRMLRKYSEDIAGVITRFKICSRDTMILNTSDDFSLLALARAIELATRTTPTLHELNVHTIFHFAIDESADAYAVANHKASQSHGQESPSVVNFGRQMNQTLQRLGQHGVHVHATTRPLANQLLNAGVARPINAVPYPTRARTASTILDQSKTTTTSQSPRRRVVLAGLPRAEKGRGAIGSVLGTLSDQIASQHSVCMSMQMPKKGWRPMVPENLHDLYETSLTSPGAGVPSAGSPTTAFEIMTSNLDTSTYHRWLDTAEIGLFLYEPERYVARASGVLLEIMARGIPTLVPSNCWLGDYVAEACLNATTGHVGCGLVYQNRDQIPALMKQMTDNYDAYRTAARSVAAQVSSQHSGRGMLNAMGINPAAMLALSSTERAAA